MLLNNRLNGFNIILLILLFIVTNRIIADTTNVHFRILDKSSGEITPVMICITNAKGNVYVPSYGNVLDSVSSSKEFYTGINFDEDKNWIGPIRKMNGKGNNEDRSYVYGLLPSIPYWQEPVMYLVSGDFTIDLPEGKWRIAVDHGMEYKPVIEEFTISKTNKLKFFYKVF